MANTVKLKRGSGSDPSASDMVVGEPVIRTDTAELFFKKDDGSVAKVSGGGGGPDFKYLALRNAANNGSASYPGNDFTLVTSGTTTAISPAAANTLLVSYGGVIQKPNSGTSTSGITGFIVDGSRIKTATNLAAAPDFILYQESGGIGEPSDETVDEAKLKVSNNPTNGYFLSAQSGNTGGLTWAAVDLSAYLPLAGGTTTGDVRFNGANSSNYLFWDQSADALTLVNGTITATTFSGSGASLTTLNASNISSGTIAAARVPTLNQDTSGTAEKATRVIVTDQSGDTTCFPLFTQGATGNLTPHTGTNLTFNSTSGLLSATLFSGSGASLTSLPAAQLSGAIANGVTATTQSASDNSTKIATTAYADTAVSNLVNGAPAALDTLNELAAAMADDAAFSTTITNSIATKLPLAGGTLTGDTTLANTKKIIFNASSGAGAYIKHQSGHFEINNDTGNTYFDTAGTLYLRTNGSTNALTLDTSQNATFAGHIYQGDGDAHFLGADNDITIFHDGNNSYIDHSGAGDLYIRTLGSQEVIRLNAAKDIEFRVASGNDVAAKFIGDGAAELYWGGTGAGKKLDTYQYGVNVTGNITTTSHVYWGDNGEAIFGAGPDLKIYSDGTNAFIKCPDTGNNLTIESDQHLYIKVGDGEDAIKCVNGQSVEIYWNNLERIRTTSSGASVLGSLYCSDNLNLTNDNKKINLGDDSDLSLFHDGGNSYIEDSGTGSLILKTGRVSFNDTGNNEMGRFDGEGLKFNGDSAAANGLDDYEIGSWDPSPNTSNPSWINTDGTYVKIGKLVHCDMWLRASGTSSSSSQIVCSLPFVATNDGNTDARPTTAAGRVYNLRNWGSNGNPFGWVSANSSNLQWMWNNNGSNPGEISMNIWQSSAELHASITYRTN